MTVRMVCCVLLHRVSLAALVSLGNCGYTGEEFPECIRPHLSLGGSDFGGTACTCTQEFDPVCDYNGHWFSNLCVAKCNGETLVEKCEPVFKEIEEKEDPFILTENDGPLIWRPGCACSHRETDANAVCDIDGRQYTNTCYADCQVLKHNLHTVKDSRRGFGSI